MHWVAAAWVALMIKNVNRTVCLPNKRSSQEEGVLEAGLGHAPSAGCAVLCSSLGRSAEHQALASLLHRAAAMKFFVVLWWAERAGFCLQLNTHETPFAPQPCLVLLS